MGFSELQKVLVLVHKGEKEDFVQALQDEAIVHITDIRESSIKEEYPELIAETEIIDKDLENRISSLARGINYLKPFSKAKGSFIEAFMEQKKPVAESLYRQVTKKGETSEFIQEVAELEKRNSILEREKTLLVSKKETLLPWKDLDIELEEIGSLEKAESVAGIIDRPPKDWKERLEAFPVDIEIVREETTKIYLVISYLKEDASEAKKTLGDIRFESISFEGFKGKPEKIIEDIENNLSQIEKKFYSISKKSSELAEKLEQFSILYDHHSSSLAQKRVDNLSFCTRDVFGIQGWIRKDDYKRLEKLTDKFETATVSSIEPEKKELPPVEMKNKKGFRLFEYLTQLYSTPKKNEVDPSPFLGPFFILFFALCLTDAFYGIVLALISWLLLKKIRGDTRLLRIFLVGGIVTIIVGALTGGWFGNLHEIIPFQWFKTMRLFFLRFGFDPIEKPMTFFFLSLGIGFIHVNLGIFLGFINYLKNKQIMRGIAEKLSWNILWICALIAGFSFFVKSLSPFKIPCVITMVLCLLLYLFGTKGMSVIEKILGVYQGFMGTISDVLSYSRLMALGLVTVGLATAINVLVQLASKLPVICFILVPIIFIGGHLFAIGINVLGAYAHSLRLEYAEFFTKFYIGGGKPFKPFQRETKYVEVV